ncbi:concanavalin A-like lectin/glucanase [Pseudovirgaria hyperparasitica]|uniref:Concanavalin A-like lectin/glucanase n=1 Tax=Pseudovirgaria hyperparasitica TaxID=470096 RepID=A0A6A6VST9_9PEZI|nr:concanavalin A-like lectin/glucanase [Pseudovirgaria hyperparasitica]KAF2753283.1 concanavalin A-like lectin/glucanase [Pseudovirgaria hyperparasitica]
MVNKALTLLAFVASTLALSTKRVPGVTKNGNNYEVGDAGIFTHSATYTFTGSSLPEGLYASEYTVEDASAPFSHRFLASNAVVRAGYLDLIIPGGQSQSPLTGAELGTVESNILYGSVRTTAIYGDVPGACNGFFFYKSDRAEIDIEWISDPKSLSNPGDGSRPLFYTNQDLNGVFADRTWSSAPSPSDISSAEHEYRIDWLPGVSRFYLDGALQKEYTTDVPGVSGSWLWNNWANGDPGWTADPPAEDNLFRIKEIEMYYNVSSKA